MAGTTDDRRDLRALWTLDPEVRFLNHGSFGACPRPVLEAQARYREEMEREPVRFLGREIFARLEGVRATLAPFLGARTEDLVFVPNATTGVNAVLRSLALAACDEVLVLDHAYNACRNALDDVCAKSGARPVVVPVPFPVASADDVLERVLGAATSATRLALLDHVTSPTGLVLPLERLVHGLAARGIDTLVDGAHAPGMVALSLDDLGAAYYTGNCHKWLCAPKGAAFLHVRADRQAGLRPTVISHGANARLNGRSRFQVEFDWVGTDDPTAVLAIPDALRFLETLFPGGHAELRARNRALALAARALLCDALDTPAPAPDDMIGSLASLRIADGDAGPRSAFDVDPLQRELYERYRIEVPVMTWPRPPERLLRVSAQAYNGLAEYEALARALVELAAAR